MVDETFKQVYDWGLGFMLDSKAHGHDDLPYSFGKHSSPVTFGHAGYQSSMGFADREHGLVVAWVFNGMPGDAEHNGRNSQTNNAIYEDLGRDRPHGPVPLFFDGMRWNKFALSDIPLQI